MNLENLGWNTFFENYFKPYLDKGYVAARVITQQKGNYIIRTSNGDYNCKISGKFNHNAIEKKDYPAVGDWVAIKVMSTTEAMIHAMLPRKSYFARKLVISGGRKIKNDQIVGGYIEEQIIGSNIDIAFIVSGLDNNFNIGRIERYITLARTSGAKPIILLNKCDLCDDVDSYIKKIKSIAFEIDVYSISVTNRTNMDIFNQYFVSGNTIIFLGSSGVGKSTIINYLFGKEIQKTNEISSSSGKGKHTTTSGLLFQHDSGCCVIDTPGLKELQLWADEDILSESFQDIYNLANKCKYNDCSHVHDAGCAIQEAILSGKLSLERFEGYKSQLMELKTLRENKKNYDHKKANKMKTSNHS